MVSIEKDEDKCGKCGLCKKICDQEGCIQCGHCVAICPQGALSQTGAPLPAPLNPDLLPSSEALQHLFQARRSCRRFKKTSPSKEQLDLLLEAARYAPTGTNRQGVRYVFVTSPEKISLLREKIMGVYARYEHHLNSRIKRFFLGLLVDKRLREKEIRTYLKRFMDRYRKGGDPLFHFAPALVFLYADKQSSTPRDDCCLALYHMVLMAERIGLGACLLGTAQIAMAKTPLLNALIGLPKDQRVLGAACFGIPDIKFQRLAKREEAQVTWL